MQNKISSYVYYKNKELYLQKTLLSQLAVKYKTPLYVYSTSVICQRLQTYLEAFHHQADIYFSIKSNSNPQVLELIQKQGVGVDVVSSGEIKKAFLAGFKSSDVIFSGVAKTSEDLEFAINKNIKQINVESPQELDRIGQIAQRLQKPASIAFRYNPDVSPETHPHITTGFRENKFGMDSSFLPHLQELLSKHKQLVLKGVTLHIGSQILSIDVMKEAISKTIPIYKHFQSLGFPVDRFDIGGGLGISYYQGQLSPDVGEFGQMVRDLLEPLGCHILCEPGRVIIGPAGVLLTQVQYIKNTPYKNFVMVDTGMHHLLRPVLYNAYHEIFNLKQKKESVGKVYDVVGPICESADVLGKARVFKGLEQDDLLAILDVGAYGYSMANLYNSHPLPKEILIP